MINLIKHKDYYGLALFVLFFVLVVYQKMISPAIGIFIIVFFVDILLNKQFKFNFKLGLSLFIILFLWYAVNIIKANHQDVGFKLLEYKMSFFIFPLIFSFKKSTHFFWDSIQGFLYGTLLLCITLIGLYFYAHQSFAELSSQYFNLHPTYSSIYITTATFILFIGYIKHIIIIPFWLFISLNTIAIFTIFALISFATILFLLCLIGGIILYYVYLKKGIVWTFLGFILIMTFSFMFIATNQRISYDYATTKATIKEIVEEPEFFIERNRDAKSGTKIRVLMWIFAYEIIQEHPMGVGLGDIDYYLDEKVKKYDINYLKTQHLNPHNQFLQIGIDTGIFGIIFLLMLLIYSCVIAFKTKNYLLLFLVLNLIFNGLFESVLQRQSGIVFYALMISYSLVYFNTKKINE